MAVLRSSDFDGTDGAAWPLSTGSWTHVTESGVFSVLTEDILSNDGRARYADSTPGVRRNHADTSFTVANAEVRATTTRAGVASANYGPGVFLRATGHAGATDSYYCLRTYSAGGKSPLYGFDIRRVLSGAHTVLAVDTSVLNLGSVTKINMAFRATNVNGGVDVLLQGKVWADGDAEPAWVMPGDLSVDGSIAIYDSSLLSAGESGVLTYLNAASSAFNFNLWSDFSLSDAPAIESTPRRVGGFANVQEMVNAELEGRVEYRTWRKVMSQTTFQGMWFDLSMSPGNPKPQYYAESPLAAVAMSRSAIGGIDHGGPVSPSTKHLRKITVTANSGGGPFAMLLMDYLLFYPFVDENETEAQAMTNIVTLPRYTDGEGVQMMAVSVAGRTGGKSFQVTYTNSDGVAGRVTQTVIENTTSVVGTIVTSQQANALARGPFIPLQVGDTGVRSIESVTMNGADVGLFTLVLVKPLAQLQWRGTDAPVEVDYFLDFAQAPRIVDDAYLSFLVCPGNSISSGVAIQGDITTVWN